MDANAQPRVLIVGAGIGGLCLALALRKHCGLSGADIEVFEQATAFTNNAGGAVGLYANGLRVLRDISPELLAAVRASGYDYIYRLWYRHDGTQVACARESELSDDPELQSLGIRRWRLQKVLFDATTAAGIKVHFKMRTEHVQPRADGTVDVTFADGTSRTVRVVFGADGLKSRVREAVVGKLAAEFTGVTCLMGAAKVPRPMRGICFPSSRTTKCHGCFYPTGEAAEPICQTLNGLRLICHGLRLMARLLAQASDTLEAQRLKREGYGKQQQFLERVQDKDKP
jgi:salicylate hydroxylase